MNDSLRRSTWNLTFPLLATGSDVISMPPLSAVNSFLIKSKSTSQKNKQTNQIAFTQLDVHFFDVNEWRSTFFLALRQ